MENKINCLLSTVKIFVSNYNTAAAAEKGRQEGKEAVARLMQVTCATFFSQPSPVEEGSVSFKANRPCSELTGSTSLSSESDGSVICENDSINLIQQPLTKIRII